MTVTTEPTAREMIPALLDRYRPDRYDPADKSWQTPVCEMVAADLDIAEALSIAASRLVSTADATATKRTNALLREIAKSGQVPLEWLDAMSWPLAVDDNERVSVRAATADDFRRFANRERRAASLDFTSRNSSCEGALHVAEQMEASGAVFARDLTPEQEP
jgi:plasmid replication initiation protein